MIYSTDCQIQITCINFRKLVPLSSHSAIWTSRFRNRVCACVIVCLFIVRGWMAAFPFPMVLRIKCTDCGGGEDVDWTVPIAIKFMDVIVGRSFVQVSVATSNCFVFTGSIE